MKTTDRCHVMSRRPCMCDGGILTKESLASFVGDFVFLQTFVSSESEGIDCKPRIPNSEINVIAP